MIRRYLLDSHPVVIGFLYYWPAPKWTKVEQLWLLAMTMRDNFYAASTPGETYSPSSGCPTSRSLISKRPMVSGCCDLSALKVGVKISSRTCCQNGEQSMFSGRRTKLEFSYRIAHIYRPIKFHQLKLKLQQPHSSVRPERVAYRTLAYSSDPLTSSISLSLLNNAS